VNLAGNKVGELEAESPALDALDAHAEHPRHDEDTHADSHGELHIHMPNPSIYPLIVSFGIFVGALGVLVDNPHIKIQLLNMPSLTIAGLVIVFAAIYGWAFEPAG